MNPPISTNTPQVTVTQSAFGSSLCQGGDDALVEYLVDNAYRRMMAAADDIARRHWCDRLTHWVKQRSQERVAQMEREKGLA